METTSTIELLLNRLKALQSSAASYLVPNIWNSEETGASLQSPAPWFIGRIEEILQTGSSTPAATFPENWQKDTVVYNLLYDSGQHLTITATEASPKSLCQKASVKPGHF